MAGMLPALMDVAFVSISGCSHCTPENIVDASRRGAELCPSRFCGMAKIGAGRWIEPNLIIAFGFTQTQAPSGSGASAFQIGSLSKRRLTLPERVPRTHPPSIRPPHRRGDRSIETLSLDTGAESFRFGFPILP